MKPILFNTEMVRAVLDGRKTQTRRPVKPHLKLRVTDGLNGLWPHMLRACGSRLEPRRSPCMIGDILWVRETWKPTGMFAQMPTERLGACARFAYRADRDQLLRDQHISWRPSIHMPREAARLFIRVTDVRVERVQDISEADAIREGVSPRTQFDHFPGIGETVERETHYAGFAKLWESIYGPRGMGWNQNPWVWVIEFEKIEKP